MAHPAGGYVDKNGNPLPGVTGVLSMLSTSSNDGLLGWAAKLARENKDWRSVRQRSAEVGTFIHDALEHFPAAMERPAWMTEPEWTKALVAYKEYGAWMERARPTIVAQEEQMVSEDLKTGGCFDLIITLPDQPGYTIADVKTGKTIDKPKVAAQLAAYAVMAKETKGIECKRGLILHMTETGLKPIEISESQLAAGLEMFRLARAAYSAVKSFPRA